MKINDAFDVFNVNDVFAAAITLESLIFIIYV